MDKTDALCLLWQQGADLNAYRALEHHHQCAIHTGTVLDKFMKSFQMNRPEMAQGNWIFQWDNSPVHTTAIVKNRPGQFRCRHTAPIHLPLRKGTSAGSGKLKEELAGVHLSHESVTNAWDEAVRGIREDGFTTALAVV
jgi:hypothetical protein